MKTKNHIKAKAPKGNSLRGIGKLGWTKSGSTLSTQRRLEATLSNEDTPLRGKKRITVKKMCVKCKRRIKVVKGKFLKHSIFRFRFSPFSKDLYVCPNSNKQI